MKYDDVLAKARETIGPNCKACPVCNGLGCGNTMPGPGSKAPGNGAHDNYMAWKKYKIEMDTFVAGSDIDTSTEFLGRRFDVPMLTAPIGSIRLQFNPTDNVADFNEKCMAACETRGIMHAFGDGLQDNILPEALNFGKNHDFRGFPVFNPDTDEAIMAKMDKCRGDVLPPAMAVVVDSAGLPHLRSLHGKGGPKTIGQLKELRAYSPSPFIIKGIMNVKSALKALECEPYAIVVSNHGGRVLPDAPATADVLPEIVAAVEGRAKIIVDGGIRTGVDAFKALALGADMFSICRPVLVSYYGGGQEGIECYIDKIRTELADTMFMAGARKIADIDKSMIRRP